jgi:predicted DNA-binding transcriptional regulator AlpA
MELLGLPSTMINTLMKAGRFPLPVQLSPRTTVWLTTDIEKWVADKATEKVA